MESFERYLTAVVDNVGVDAMGQGNSSYGYTALTTFPDDLGFELRAVITSCGARAIDLVRTGVYDLHGAHYRFD